MATVTQPPAVADVIVDHAWKWPSYWYTLFPFLCSIQIPRLHDDREDKLTWKWYTGIITDFSVCNVWNAIRSREVCVDWSRSVWSPYGIPRHLIPLWLVMKGCLKTQDRLKQWDVGKEVDLSMLKCPLCSLTQDSHSHLFFECRYSVEVWSLTTKFAELPNVRPQWTDIIAWLIPLSRYNNVTSIVGCLVQRFILHGRKETIQFMVNRRGGLPT